MQHRSSITVTRLLAGGYRITREMDNGQCGDAQVSICELKKRGAPTLYILANNAWADTEFENWRSVKRAMKEASRRRRSDAR